MRLVRELGSFEYRKMIHGMILEEYGYTADTVNTLSHVISLPVMEVVWMEALAYIKRGIRR